MNKTQKKNLKPQQYRKYHRLWGDECNKRKNIKDIKISPRMFLWNRIKHSPLYGKNYFFKALRTYKISDKSKKDIQKLKEDYQTVIQYLENPKKMTKNVSSIIEKHGIKKDVENILKHHKTLKKININTLRKRQKKKTSSGKIKIGNYSRDPQKYGKKNKKIISTEEEAIKCFQDTYIKAYDLKGFYDNKDIHNITEHSYTEEDYCKEKYCIQAMRANMSRNRNEKKIVLNGDLETCKLEINSGKIDKALCKGEMEEIDKFLLYIGESKNYQFRTGDNLKRHPVKIKHNGKEYIIQKATPSGARIYNMAGINCPNNLIGETVADMKLKQHYRYPFGERTHPDFIL